MLLPCVLTILQRLRNHYGATDGRVVVGVITNSDPRVPDILSSLGLRVSTLRFGGQPSKQEIPDQAYDIEFAVMSYDVGHEKPDKRIFAAAEEMLNVISRAGGNATRDIELSLWQKVYVGDEYDKDVIGAVNAGWDAVLIDAEGPAPQKDLKWLDDSSPGDLRCIFNSSRAVGFSSLGKLAEWFPKEQ